MFTIQFEIVFTLKCMYRVHFDLIRPMISLFALCCDTGVVTCDNCCPPDKKLATPWCLTSLLDALILYLHDLRQ